MNSLIWLLALALLSIAAIVGTTKRIEEGSVALVERLGRYHRTLVPGIHFGILPFIDEIVVTISRREQILDITPGDHAEATTIDDVRVAVEVIVFWRIVEPEKAYYAIEEIEQAIKSMVTTVIRSEIRRMTFQEANHQCERIIRALLESLDEVTKPWGAIVTRVEIQEIKLVNDASDLISLPLPAGINWKALEQSFLVVAENENLELKVQSISQRADGIWVIQVKVPSNANKELVLEDLIHNYTNAVQVLEARYRAELRGKEEQLAIYRQHYSSLEGFIHTLANRGVPHLTIEAKAINQTGVGEMTMGNQGDTYNVGQAGAVGKYARSDNNTFYQSEQKQTLAEAAREIQQLLQQLEQTNPTATEAQKIAYVNDETTPSFKRRVVGALQAGGEAAIEEFLANPYVNVGKAIVKGWLKPE
ncbi:MAG: hypothetical protein Kow00121_26610 [Elainellaceae cyanobacterium]